MEGKERPMPNNNPHDPAHSEYIAAVVDKKPNKDDPKEIAIREKIRAHVSEAEWGPATFEHLRQQQISYLQEMFGHVLSGNTENIYTRTQVFLKEIALELKAEIVDGKEILEKIPQGKSALLMTNHLGLYKLAGLNPQEELGVDIPKYDFMYPSPLYFGGLYPVAEALGDNLSYVSDDFPGIFGTIHRKAGFVHVPPPGKVAEGRTALLMNQTKNTLDACENTAIVNYPEGGTSGKYSGLGPYDLDPFKTGGYVIASQLRIPVVLVGQYFHPEKGLQLGVLDAYIPDSADKEGYERYVEHDKQRMQVWLDQRRSA